MIVKIQSEDWFRKNCFQDGDLDWWLCEELFDIYNNSDNTVGKEYYYTGDFDEVIDLTSSDKYYLRHFGELSWCIKEIYTPTTHPEMFL